MQDSFSPHVQVSGSDPLPPYSFTNVWGLGWSRWRASFLPLFLGTLIVAAVSVPLQLPNLANIPAQVARSRAAESPDAAQVADAASGLAGIVTCFALLWSGFVVLPIAGGFLWMGIQAARGSVPTVGSILQGYRRFPTVLGGTFLTVLVFLVPYVLAVAVPVAVVMSQSGWDFEQLSALLEDQNSWDAGFVASLVISVVWIAVCIVVLYWIGLRLSMWMSVAMDDVGPRYGAWASINRSWRITKGSALSLFGLLITASLMTAFTALLCCAPYFVVGIPLYVTLCGLAYAMLSQQETARDASATPAQ